MAQKYTVELDIKNFDQNVQKLLQQLKELQKTLDNTHVNTQKVSKASTEGGMSFTKMAGAVGLGVSAYSLLSSAISKTVQFMKDSVKVAMEEEKDQSRLYNALDRNIEAYGRISDFKDEITRTTTFSKEEIDSSINMALELGRTEEQTKKMILAAQGLSKVTGKDLNTSMQVLSATFEGSIGKLGKYSSEIKKLTQDQLRNGEAIEIISKKFGKFATEGIDTASGAIDQYNKSLEQLQVNIGTKSLPYIRDFNKALTSIVNTVNDWVEIPLSDNLKEEQKNVNELVNSIVLLEEGSETRNKLVDELLTKYPSYFQGLTTETAHNADLLLKLNDVNFAFERKIELMLLDEKMSKLGEDRLENMKQEDQILKELNKDYDKFVGKPIPKNLFGDKRRLYLIQEINKAVLKEEQIGADGVGRIVEKSGADIAQNYLVRFSKIKASNILLNKEVTEINRKQELAQTDLQKKLTDQESKFNSASLSQKKQMLSELNRLKKEADDKYKEAQGRKDLSPETGTAKYSQDLSDLNNYISKYNKSIEQLTPIYDPKKAKEAYDEQQKQNQLRNDNNKKSLQEKRKFELENEKLLIDTYLLANETLIKNEKDKSNANIETLKKYYQERTNLIELNTQSEIQNYQNQIDEINTLSIIQTMSGTLTPEDTERINSQIQNLINKINSAVAKGSASREQNEKETADSIFNTYKKQVEDIQKLTEDKPATKEDDFSGNANKLAEYQNKLIEQKTLLLEKQLEIQNDSTKSDKEKVDALDAVNKALKTNSNEIETNTKSISENIKQNLENIANTMQDIFSKMGLSAPIQQLGNDIIALFKTLEDSSLSAEERTKAITENIKQLAIDTAGAISDVIINGMLKDNERQFESSLESLNKQFDEENEKLEKLHKAKIIDDTTYNKRKKANDEKRAKEEEELKKKKSKSDWESAISGSIINTALGVTAALTAGPGTGIALAIVTAALGLIETGLIIAQGPAYEKGGLVKGLGGLLQGPSHSQGGIPLVAEGNEYIIKKSVVQQPGMLNYLEKINNGEGVVGSSVAVIDNDSLRSIVEEVVIRTASIPVINVESESTSVARRVANIESKSSW